MSMTNETCPRCNGTGSTPLYGCLRTIREDAGHSLGHVAREIGVSTPYLSRVELGKCRVSPFIARVYLEIGCGILGATTKDSWAP